jgi:hypothetical protein
LQLHFLFLNQVKQLVLSSQQLFSLVSFSP